MRKSGILLHPSSLPHSGPTGDIGLSSYRFLDWLETSGSQLWQVLPLHPPGGGFSPYSSPSAFAGATYLISLELLVKDNLLRDVEIQYQPWRERVDETLIKEWKMPLLEKAAQRLLDSKDADLQNWRSNTHWIEDWALYSVLQKEYGGWQQFPKELRVRQRKALDSAREQYEHQMNIEVALQYIFFRQWAELRNRAKSKGIEIVGDMPIFIGNDGCEVWTRPDLFRLNKDGWPDPEAGAPPDMFSPLGQCWGNPHYNWKTHRKEKFKWWIERLRGEILLADWVRIDHFRGFCAAWEIPKSAMGDGRQGKWGKTPGKEIFRTVKKALGDLPFIAEDLGEITPDVDAFREELGFMGMKILQFAFDDYTHKYLPHNFENDNFAVYTGTHDNDTTLGWYQSVSEDQQHRYRVYCGRNGSEPHWDLIRSAWSSIAKVAIAPYQDVLGLDSSGRMNIPGLSQNNWTWRSKELPQHLANRLRFLTEAYGRLPEQQDG